MSFINPSRSFSSQKTPSSTPDYEKLENEISFAASEVAETALASGHAVSSHSIFPKREKVILKHSTNPHDYSFGKYKTYPEIIQKLNITDFKDQPETKLPIFDDIIVSFSFNLIKEEELADILDYFKSKRFGDLNKTFNQLFTQSIELNDEKKLDKLISFYYKFQKTLDLNISSNNLTLLSELNKK